VVQAGLGKKLDPMSKITRVKRAGGVTQVIEYLPSKNKILSSNPSTTQKKKKLCHLQENAASQTQKHKHHMQDLDF
jgi:dihydroxyacid dehydratase/phosphogluconate dehydratase